MSFLEHEASHTVPGSGHKVAALHSHCNGKQSPLKGREWGSHPPQDRAPTTGQGHIKFTGMP